MRFTEQAMSARAARRGNLMLAIIATRKAEQHLNAGAREDLIVNAMDEAVAALARATAPA